MILRATGDNGRRIVVCGRGGEAAHRSEKLFNPGPRVSPRAESPVHHGLQSELEPLAELAFVGHRSSGLVLREGLEPGELTRSQLVLDESAPLDTLSGLRDWAQAIVAGQRTSGNRDG